MNADTQPGMTAGDVLTEAAGWAVAGGILTMALFPFAVPGIVLVVAAVVPLLLLAVPLALVAGVVALPVLAVRRLRRPRTTDRDRAATHRAPGQAHLAGVHR